ncbi:hypothetical protein D9M68_780650 [compost metagenome]
MVDKSRVLNVAKLLVLLSVALPDNDKLARPLAPVQAAPVTTVPGALLVPTDDKEVGTLQGVSGAWAKP